MVTDVTVVADDLGFFYGCRVEHDVVEALASCTVSPHTGGKLTGTLDATKHFRSLFFPLFVVLFHILWETVDVRMNARI